MSETRGASGINDLVDYLEKHREFMEEARNVTGLLAPLSFRVFNETYKRARTDLPGSDKSPFYLFQFQEEEKSEYADILFYKALNLAKMGTPYKLFGLTFKDLLNMDYPTFSDIDEACREEQTRKNKTMEEVKDELDEEQTT